MHHGVSAAPDVPDALHMYDELHEQLRELEEEDELDGAVEAAIAAGPERERFGACPVVVARRGGLDHPVCRDVHNHARHAVDVDRVERNQRAVALDAQAQVEAAIAGQ